MSARDATAMPRLLRGITSRPLSLDEHVEVHGRLPRLARRSAGALLDDVAASGLRGHGGAHVATALKLRAVARRHRPVLVANGAESEPASRKDSTLLEHAPHLVIDGLVAAAAAVGAPDAILYVKPTGACAYDAVRSALEERGSADRVKLRLEAAPSTYVAGQETAVIAQLNGRPPVPTTVPPRPFERGVDHRPTVVCNVETFAHLALIARHGPAWFRALGSHDQPGTALLTVSGAVESPGVYETSFHTPLTDLVVSAGGLTQPVQALLVGGYGGSWLPAAQLPDLALSDSDPRLRAGSIGAGVLVVLGADACGLTESARVLEHLARQSAAQCGPCRFGLRAIADGFAALVRGVDDPAIHERLQRWAGDVTGRGACRHPDGAARFASSALAVFAPEIAGHRSGRCTGSRGPVLPVPDTLAPAA